VHRSRPLASDRSLLLFRAAESAGITNAESRLVRVTQRLSKLDACIVDLRDGHPVWSTIKPENREYTSAPRVCDRRVEQSRRVLSLPGNFPECLNSSESSDHINPAATSAAKFWQRQQAERAPKH